MARSSLCFRSSTITNSFTLQVKTWKSLMLSSRSSRMMFSPSARMWSTKRLKKLHTWSTTSWKSSTSRRNIKFQSECEIKHNANFGWIFCCKFWQKISLSSKQIMNQFGGKQKRTSWSFLDDGHQGITSHTNLFVFLLLLFTISVFHSSYSELILLKYLKNYLYLLMLL